MSSLRRRLSVAVVGITSVVVAVAACGIYLGTRALLIGGVDADLQHWADRVNRPSPAVIGLPPLLRRPPAPPGRNDARRFMQILDAATGRELMRSPGAAEDLVLPQPAPGQGLPATLIGQLPDGRPVRVLAIGQPWVPGFVENDHPTPSPVAVVILLAQDMSTIDAELARMAGLLGALWVVATLLAWGAVLALRAAILRPLHSLIRDVARLGPDDLAARLGDAAGPDEMRALVSRLNGLLDRLQQAFQREQATIANIAHELRTPVAVLRSDLEFRLLAATAPDERGVLEGCLGTVERMQSLVSNLLLLARLEAGKEPLRREAVDVAALVAEAAERDEAVAVRRGQRLHLALPAQAPATSAGEHLRLIIDNLLGNALAHGSAGGEIRIAVASAGGAIEVSVDNAFAGSVDASLLGKPFYRGDGARRDSDHSGLGLTLCSRLARLLGGRLDLAAHQGRFTARLTLPVGASA